MKNCSSVMVIAGILLVAGIFLLEAGASDKSSGPVAELSFVVLKHDNGTVSYTHLDVYKRQKLALPCASVLSSRPPRSCLSFLPTVCITTPAFRTGFPLSVSYTHLDVYKRQIIDEPRA